MIGYRWAKNVARVVMWEVISPNFPSEGRTGTCRSLGTPGVIILVYLWGVDCRSSGVTTHSIIDLNLYGHRYRSISAWTTATHSGALLLL